MGWDMDNEKLEQTWAEFLAEWPIERLRNMTLDEYSRAGDTKTFTYWVESRLDKLGSIWGGSAFKFGIFSRRNRSPKASESGTSYSTDYAWYTKYGASPEEAFEKVRSLVVGVAGAAARADYRAIDAIDLGTAYKWKIAFHYQDRARPGVICVFLRKNLQKWLQGRVGSIPQEMSELYRLVLGLAGSKDLLTIAKDVWEETFVPEEKPKQPGAKDPDVEEPPDPDLPAHQPLNLVLYGPPGTGKTYATAELAVGICDGVVPEGREALMARYRELRNLRRIRFVTFHPSFSYEEFVEGIRPATQEDGSVGYEVRAGILKQAVTQARELFERRSAAPAGLDLRGRKLFKMSLGDVSLKEESWIFGDCIENGYACIGFGLGIDFTGAENLEAVRDRYLEATPGGKRNDYAATAVHYLKNEVRKGDLLLVSKGNRRFRAIGEVTGPYRFVDREGGYGQQRPVRWLWSSEESLPIEMVFAKNLSQMTVYLMDQSAVNWRALEELIAPKRTGGEAPNCVLVIDEINRANLAKTFGELITLLEPSKRLGQADEQEAELPYSGDSFGVPPNLFVLATMNTADRSIALMDTALRRRFSFQEMPPRSELLEEDMAGVNLRALLEAMNARIESLFDRDHVLGHTYLMGLSTFEDLVERFRSQIIPLLQEYFFEDWRRIQRVLNDSDHPADRQIIQELEGETAGSPVVGGQRRYRVNPVISPAAIQKIYE